METTLNVYFFTEKLELKYNDIDHGLKHIKLSILWIQGKIYRSVKNT